MPDSTFWSRQRVLVTGHTGFKGSWLALWLECLGAELTGYALEPENDPNLFHLIETGLSIMSVIGDIRDREAIASAVRRANPTIVIHLAAQSLVRRGYTLPVETFATNVIGTAHLLDTLSSAEHLKAVLVVTSDKVYRNDNSGRPFVESDPLGGRDPYSASKAATELVSASWGSSFFADRGVPVITARAGNVLGGGDWSEDRLVPDIWRANRRGKSVTLRSPQATRPWQHVVDSLAGYLLYIEQAVQNDPNNVPAALNFGPVVDKPVTVAEVTELMLSGLGSSLRWQKMQETQPLEMHRLALNAERARRTIGWGAKLDGRETLDWTAEWYRRYEAGDDPRQICLDQISGYEALT